MPNLFTIDQQLPKTSVEALREFDDRYIASIGAAQPDGWTDLGDTIPTNAPIVTFPISALAVKYEEFQGENRFKTLLDKSFDIKSAEFDTGLEAKLIELLTQIFAYRNWLEGPSRFLNAEKRFVARQIAALLEAGESTKWVDGQMFFSTAHPSDLTTGANGTWSNLQTSPKDVLDIANIEAEVTAMQTVKDENGDELDIDPDTILVPTPKYERLKNLLAQNMILEVGGTGNAAVAAVNNPYVGRFQVKKISDFKDPDDWYLVDSKKRASTGLAPWINMRWTVPNPALALRKFDENSDFFKRTGKLRISSHIWHGFALGFPHTIRKVKGA